MNRENIKLYLINILCILVTIITVVSFYYFPLQGVPDWYPDVYEIRLIVLIVCVSAIIILSIMIRTNNEEIKDE